MCILGGTRAKPQRPPLVALPERYRPLNISHAAVRIILSKDIARSASLHHTADGV